MASTIDELETLAAARAGDAASFEKLVQPYHRELGAHCYRMSGSIHDAEELLQEVLVRAWRGLAGFEGRARVRTWLYKIATNVCLGALEARRARALPMDLRGAGDPSEPMTPSLEPIWLEPCPPRLYDTASSPQGRYDRRENVALAFLAALQLLPARHRAVLILHDVIGLAASECAELLEISAAAVNSILQRARRTLEARRTTWQPAPIDDDVHRKLLERYVRAWEASDVRALISVLHEDATLAMPPIPVWLHGVDALEQSIQAMVFADAAPGTFHVREAHASGEPAIAVWRRDPSDILQPFALQTLTWRGDKIVSIVAFLDTRLFDAFGLVP